MSLVSAWTGEHLRNILVLLCKLQNERCLNDDNSLDTDNTYQAFELVGLLRAEDSVSAPPLILKNYNYSKQEWRVH
jgi:hypothetical protein